VSLDGLTELRQRLERVGAEMPRIVTRAINYAGAKTTTQGVRDLEGEQRALGAVVPQRTIRRHVRFRRATFDNPVGMLSVSGRISAQWFKPVRQLPFGVQAGRLFFVSAFLAVGRSAPGVWIRVTPSTHATMPRRSPNLPIERQYGPPSQEIFQSKFLQASIAMGQDALAREAERQLSLLLNGGQLPGAEPTA
jgi:hypothetical protein